MRVLVTRPRHQSEQLIKALESHGFEPELLPLLDIQAIRFPEASEQAFVKKLAEADKIVAVSANAAEMALPFFAQLTEISADLFAIGPSTAAVLQAKDYVVHIPEQQQYNSEALMALPAFQQIEGQSILLLCGQGGRDYLEQSLKHGGAKVDRMELYQRVPLPDSHLGLNDIASPDVLTAMSGDTVEVLDGVLIRSGQPNWKGKPLIVPGERVAKIARDKGFTQVLASAKPTTESLLSLLQQL